MGNSSSSKLAEKCPMLEKSELPLVATSFRLASKNSDKCKEEDLMKFWGSQMDPRLAQYITNFLFGPLGSRASFVELPRFAELYVYTVRGTKDERINVLLSSLGQAPESESPEIAYPLIKEYVEAVVSSYMRAIRLEGGPEFKSWESRGFRIVKECIQKLAEGLVYDVVQQGTQKVTRADAERWLSKNPIFLRMLEHVFSHLFNYRNLKNTSDERRKDDSDESRSRRKENIPQPDVVLHTMLPLCEGLQYMPDYPAFTDLSQMLFVNANLPAMLQNKWRFLFSSQIHGESFSTLLGRIIDQGPTVVIVEDSNGFIFGGYATDAWALSPNFCGNDNSFLFTLRPKMRCFPSTGYNNHYQYMNLHQQTMPNGMGMGGQFGYWGLWLDCEYGIGECSESCSTYKGYLQMSATKKFTVRNVEVWGVGEKPVKEDDELEPEHSKTSVLDGNADSKAMLRMGGREQYSDGYRDEPKD
ncbi:MTOR-associated protein MEAK7 [Uranotaenia lowii]|uniref:MTOR-associated protein MEAK7 n=1 Tax=Uranotaenia lowii TaxID=190385 RepID=UPI00247ACCAE|nr:MTOR-associated protein MEAK7 [Uranotaenia lowii]XP_055592678.1 MTOR-associated protein MEAK7 [Uranotaenia lowii]